MSAGQRSTSGRLVAATALYAALCSVTSGFENGPPPGFTGDGGEPDCSICHFDFDVNDPGGALTISGLPDAFVSGERYALSVALQHAELETGGFQLAIRDAGGKSAGTIQTQRDDVTTISVDATGMTYAQHSESRARAADNSVTWTIVWEAPEDSSDVSVGVSANAANGDASEFGDYIFTTAVRISNADTSAATAPAPHNADVPRQDSPTPRFWRETRYNLRWAGAASNLSYITRYIAEGMLEELGRDTGYIAYGTRGNSTSVNIYSVGDHEVDFALTTPPVMASLAYAGKAYFDKAYTDLRAIAVFPQNDWVMCVADAELGIESFADIRERELAVKVATNRIGRDNGVSFLVEQIFRAHGITPGDIERWGGGFVEVLGAGAAASKVLDGEADIGCHEYWKAFYRLTEVKPVAFLPVTEAAMAELTRQFDYRPNVVPKDVFAPGVPATDVPVVDYSDWLVLVNAKVPDDIAYLAAKVAVEERERGYERIYWGQTDRQRAADIPVDPKLMWQNVGVALHPGAERYYREAGLMP